MQKENKHVEVLVSNLIDLLSKGNAHVTLDEALQDVPYDLLGKKPNGLPYTIWQLAQHIRIAQEDILNFSKDPSYKSPPWPEGYWPKETQPDTASQWTNCVQQIMDDREAFINLLKDAGEEIYKPFVNANGQTLLREALVLADHNSYHTAEIILLRRLLNNWK